MASFISIPQFLVPRGMPTSSARILALRNNAGIQRQRGVRGQPKTSLQQSTPFSSTPSPSAKPRRVKSTPKQPQQQQQHQEPSSTPTLEKPDKFRPPSHPARRVMLPGGRTANAANIPAPRNYPGPARSAEEVEASKTKRYPNSFPPEGTVMHRFLTNRGIHVWISMSILFSLAIFTFTTNFKQTSPFAHLLPPWSGLLTAPYSTLSQALSVYKMHVEAVSLQTAEKRKRKVDDVEKRRMYRVAHGMEEPQDRDFAGKLGAGGGGGGVESGEEGGEAVVKKQPKRWFGIW
ncbi:hypothetical protein FQN54_004122 [Arachnomyces sp. PD_36]|nr:hypothetical protein FQN54_004122 [Arachnomyces sp. PD_36]